MAHHVIEYLASALLITPLPIFGTRTNQAIVKFSSQHSYSKRAPPAPLELIHVARDT